MTVLSAVGILGDRSILLLGSATIAAWLLVSASRASAVFSQTHDDISIRAATGTRQVVAGEQLTLSVSATTADRVGCPVTVDVTFPAGVDTEDLTLELQPGQERVRQVLSPSFIVAGEFTVPTMTVRYESADGLFSQSVPSDAGVTVTVDPRGLDDLHIGTGGERTRLFGGSRGMEHADRGDDVASTREYEPGDALRRIDWKATARLDEPFVREFESDHERRIRLFVDARARLRVGEPGRTPLNYLREVALQTTASAARGDNPLGLTIVDDNGIRTVIQPARTDDHYRRIHDALLGLDTDPVNATETTVRLDNSNPLSAYRTAEILSQRSETAFTSTLLSYFQRTESYVDRLAEDQLFEAVRRWVTKDSPGGMMVVLTDDKSRGRLTDTVRLATRRGGYATVCMAPSALFEDRSLKGRSRTFDQYSEFEEYRRSVDRIPRANAFEVGPETRLQDILAEKA